MPRYHELYLDVRHELFAAGEPNATLVARELVCKASGKTLEQLIADGALYTSDRIEQEAREYLRRKLEGEPLAYILGEWDFCSMTMSVPRGVLIPRDDTAVVAETAADYAAGRDPTPRVLDLCCGTGCIGIFVARKLLASRITLADISPEALSAARENRLKSGASARITVIEADALAPAPEKLGKFDLIVANPPYITEAEMETLDVSVRDYEPRLALCGGADGLDFYRAISKNWKQALKNEGVMVFEIGMGQAPDVEKIMTEGGYELLEIRKDAEGVQRAMAFGPKFK